VNADPHIAFLRRSGFLLFHDIGEVEARGQLAF
jgi:hypothetical protein